MEKIWDLEIPLTALLWNKSAASHWLCCSQAAEPTAALELEAGVRAGKLALVRAAARVAHTCSPGRPCCGSALERNPSTPWPRQGSGQLS